MQMATEILDKDDESNDMFVGHNTSSHAVVKDTNEYEDDLKAGENNEQKIEGISHLLGGENKDTENVPNNA